MLKDTNVAKIRRKKNEIVLREYRESRGLTQLELAKLLGLDRRTISAYEVGSRMPPVRTAIKIAKIFNVKIEDIFPISC